LHALERLIEKEVRDLEVVQGAVALEGVAKEVFTALTKHIGGPAAVLRLAGVEETVVMEADESRKGAKPPLPEEGGARIVRMAAEMELPSDTRMRTGVEAVVSGTLYVGKDRPIQGSQMPAEVRPSKRAVGQKRAKRAVPAHLAGLMGEADLTIM
jgi:hypothetical protein